MVAVCVPPPARRVPLPARQGRLRLPPPLPLLLGLRLICTPARLLQPSYRNRTPHLLKPVRQLIESVNDTLNGQLDLELLAARVAQRPLAPTAAIRHDPATG